jgi:hypothetical protein
VPGLIGNNPAILHLQYSIREIGDAAVVGDDHH